MARRGLIAVLTILALFLLGTIVVLSSVSFYLHIDSAAYLEDDEIFRLERYYDDHKLTQADEKIPRIIHQTWKTDVLPDRWRIVSQGCKDLMPD
jgi:mannosyltransferase OCH1-like enzyme